MGKIVGKERDRIIQEEYINKDKSRAEVAKMLGMKYRRFCAYLISNEIRKNKGKDTYQNRDWLYNEYVVNHASSAIIAKKLCCSRSIIYHWLQKHDINRRSNSETRSFRTSCNLSPHIKEFITGELLGDGSLFSRSKYTAYYQHGTKYREYLVWIEKIFFDFGIKKTGTIRKNAHTLKSNGKTYISYSLKTVTYPELKSLRIWFYPNGKKIIPYNLELTPLIVRQWYLGDGSLSKKVGNMGQTISISTEGFQENDIDRVIEKFKRIGLKLAKNKSRKGQYKICISRQSTIDFFDYIGPCPQEIETIYSYKWPKQI